MNLPDGTGGFYDAVNNNELLREWDFLGIKYLHVMGIDNLLGRPVDPTLLGMLRGVDGVENGLEVVTRNLLHQIQIKICPELPYTTHSQLL